MTILDWIHRAELVLTNSDSPRLDAELLVCHVLGWDRVNLQLQLREELKEKDENRLEELLTRRSTSEPMAYILGQQSFSDFMLEVEKSVLIPRPETESVLNTAVMLAKDNHLNRIYEIGTGSGAIAIGLARALPNATIIASDISPEALKVARRNVEKYNLQDRVELILSDLGDHIYRAELVVANLPYLPTDLKVSPEVNHEPQVALWSGDDGLDHYRKLLSNVDFEIAVIELGSNQYQPLVEWVATNLDKKITLPITDIGGEVVGMIIKKNGPLV